MTPDIEPVVIGSSEVSIELGRPEHAADGSGTRIPIRIVAQGVDVRSVVDVESWSGGIGSLVDYFHGLAAAWKGWPGTKEWSDDGPNISLGATHDGVGHVALRVTADPFAGWDGPGSWRVAVSIPIEPGSLDDIARSVTALLHESGEPS